MTVDRPTPISSGYLKAFNTGHKRERERVSAEREGAREPWFPPHTLSVSSTPTHRVSAETRAPQILHLAQDSERSSPAILKK